MNLPADVMVECLSRMASEKMNRPMTKKQETNSHPECARKSKEATVSVAYLHECFRYDPCSGELYWKKRPQEHFAKGNANSWNALYEGKKAGWVRTRGYLAVAINYVSFSVHRVVWAMVSGSWPSDCIDHIDGNTANNRFTNLRSVTQEQNARNAALRRDNKTGFPGVQHILSSNTWRAVIRYQGRLCHLGTYGSALEAIAARRAAEKLIGFHQNHGRPAPSREMQTQNLAALEQATLAYAAKAKKEQAA